jgi:hypothetical protein
MRRAVLTFALTAIALLTQVDRASAQIVYGYQTYVPGSGVVIGNRGFVTPYTHTYRSGYYYPWTAVGGRQAYYGDVFGNRAAQSYGYNPWTNVGYSRGYYFTPGVFYGPYYTGPVARQYSFYFRR